MKPCLIIYIKPHARFEAFSETGESIAFSHLSFVCFNNEMRERGFENVALNSRLGRTIMDKINHESV